MKRLQLSGQRFGRLLVISDTGEGSESYWLCRCDCGREHTVRGVSLRRGLTRSCGCLQADLTAQRERTHGMKNTREYRSYTAAKQRCTNPKNPKFPSYGGRGIRFLFSSFEEFFAHVGPSPQGKTLDRINNDGPYAIGNVRWGTASEQRINQRPMSKAAIENMRAAALRRYQRERLAAA